MSLHVVEISKITPHPNATKLSLCTVTDSKNETSLVCGASNIRVGMRTVLAPVGSETPLGTKIQATEIRGESSHGMLCSAKDLGVNLESGIVDLPEHIELNTKLQDIPNDFLSSTPWHQFKEVEQLYLDEKTNKISVCRNGEAKESMKLVSKTYYHDGQYQYRHF
jgi:tRNA-binding EMAP/Myf-like protein